MRTVLDQRQDMGYVFAVSQNVNEPLATVLR